VTTTPEATSTLTHRRPATGPANTTRPPAGTRTIAPGGDLRSMPRWPGPYGPLGGSNPRASGPWTGGRSGGTRPGGMPTMVANLGGPAPAVGAAVTPTTTVTIAASRR
jgi:hypothetical protein